MARRGKRNELVVISWRDIPAQVNGGVGDDKQQWILPRRFHSAIDRAAMKAGKKAYDEYVGEWRRTTIPLPDDFDGDYRAAVLAEAQRIEDVYPTTRLSDLVRAGGWDPARPEHERN
jgi:hypothetical protein